MKVEEEQQLRLKRMALSLCASIFGLLATSSPFLLSTCLRPVYLASPLLQMYPNAAASTLLKKFFYVFKQW